MRWNSRQTVSREWGRRRRLNEEAAKPAEFSKEDSAGNPKHHESARKL